MSGVIDIPERLFRSDPAGPELGDEVDRFLRRTDEREIRRVERPVAVITNGT